MLFLTIITFIVATLTLVVAVCSLCAINGQFRLNLVSSVLLHFSTNEKIHNTYYEKFEYAGEKQFQYDDKNFRGSNEEQEIDALLRIFSVVAIAWENKQINLNDTLPIEYYICRVVENTELQKYLDWHSKWLESEKIKSHPFLVLRKLSSEISKKKD
ncbi:MAG: hypothetical protein LBU65_01020 [Planctomycetaceae bacterium]|jgi:hypothetical protein|nr:hypothetical protein [Planctomycetaceae bacterium]